MQYIPESEASDSLQKTYAQLKKALEVPHIPLFFTYLGPFPEYLEYISDQIIRNVQDERFQELQKGVGEQIVALISKRLSSDEERENWLKRYRFSPSFGLFQEQLDDTYILNTQLVFIFVALREAVKGWVVAAPLLEAARERREKDTSLQHDEKDFLIEGYLSSDLYHPAGDDDASRRASGAEDVGIIHPGSEIVRHEEQPVEKNLLVEYLDLNRHLFFHQSRRDEYVFLRVEIEKIILYSLQLMPYPIVSPINVVLQLSSQYCELPDLLHLLSDHFPTLAVQMMIFSGYLKRSK